MNISSFKLETHLGQDEKQRQGRHVGRAEGASGGRQVVNEADDQTLSHRVHTESFQELGLGSKRKVWLNENLPAIFPC